MGDRVEWVARYEDLDQGTWYGSHWVARRHRDGAPDGRLVTAVLHCRLAELLTGLGVSQHQEEAREVRR